MNHVWAFKYANLGENPIEDGHEKHLIASGLAEATERANQFLIDDGLKHASYTEHGYDFQITAVRRIATLDWPVNGEYVIRATSPTP